MDFTLLDMSVQELVSAGIASSNQKSYTSGARRFEKFCQVFAISLAYLVDEQTLSRLLAYLFNDGLSFYFTAVRYTQISLGHGDPHISRMARLEYVIKGAKRSGLGRRHRLPITPGILEYMKSVWPSSPDAKRYCYSVGSLLHVFLWLVKGRRGSGP